MSSNCLLLDDRMNLLKKKESNFYLSESGTWAGYYFIKKESIFMVTRNLNIVNYIRRSPTKWHQYGLYNGMPTTINDKVLS